MSALDPRIEAVRAQYGLTREDFWELPQKKGTWVAKHAALEVAAVKADIRFDMPMVLEAGGADGVCAVCVQGSMGERTEWSIGEASPKNNKNAYPWAMAEKRGKDRVILKLIGIHGLVYSEEEADDFKRGGIASPPVDGDVNLETLPKAKSRDNYSRLSAANRDLKTIKDFNKFWSDKRVLEAAATLPLDWKMRLSAEKEDKAAELEERVQRNGTAGLDPTESLDRQFGAQ